MQVIFLDTETTGLDPASHRILDIAFKIVDMSTGQEKVTYQAIVKQPAKVWKRRDLLSVAVNGFNWDKTSQGKEEKIVAQEIIQIFTEFEIHRNSTVYLCQNPAFDRSFFSQLIPIQLQEQKKWPYHWLDLASMYWILQVQASQKAKSSFPKELSLSKNAIAEHYQLPIEATPHSAINGVDHLLLCYHAVASSV